MQKIIKKQEALLEKNIFGLFLEIENFFLSKKIELVKKKGIKNKLDIIKKIEEKSKEIKRIRKYF